jgi:hypothetical protein
MSRPPAFNLTPAGYLILQEAEQARLANKYRRDFGPYSGVDRLPPLFPPEPAIRKSLGEPPVQDMRLYAAMEEWFDARFGNTAFIPNRSQALRLLNVFKVCGLQFEPVYCQLAWGESEACRQNDYALTDEKPPVISLTYGFDVSWPSCNHSAILQPGVVTHSSPWRQNLNQYGLLDKYEDAVQLRAEYLAIYPYPPFDVFVVHKVVAGP